MILSVGVAGLGLELLDRNSDTELRHRPRHRDALPYYNPGVHFVYIVRCADGTLYTGYARDPKARVKIHNRGRGARYTSGRRPVRLVYFESCESVGDALRREYALKRRSRVQKELLIGTRRAGRAAGLGRCVQR